jgi:hypothetical protein
LVAWRALTSCGENRRITAPHSEEPWAVGRRTCGELYLEQESNWVFFLFCTTVNMKSLSVRRHNGQAMSVYTISNIQDVSRLLSKLSITISCREGSGALRKSRTVFEAKYFSFFYIPITHSNKRTRTL